MPTPSYGLNTVPRRVPRQRFPFHSHFITLILQQYPVMKTLVRLLRKAGFILILIVAAFAVGVTGHFLPITRERYQNKSVSTEQVDRKKEDDEPETEPE